jgi:hypothetical protein
MRKTVEEIKLEISKSMDNVHPNYLANALYKKLIETRFELANGYTIDRAYDPNFGDDRLCTCGHPYYRHFDTYEDMYPIGCKYCHSIGEVIPNSDDPEPNDKDEDRWYDWYGRQQFNYDIPDCCIEFKEKI